MKRKGLIRSIIAAVFAVLTYVALAFNFVLVSVSGSSSVGSTSRSTSWSFGDWQTSLGSDYEKLGLWKFAKALLIITLILVVVVVVLSIVNLFVDNKIVTLINKITSIVGLVVSIAFLVVFVAGGLVLSESATSFGTTLSTTYLPNFGSILLGVSGIVTTALTLSLSSNKKKKKA